VEIVAAEGDVLMAPSRPIKLEDQRGRQFIYASLFCGKDILEEAWPQGKCLLRCDQGLCPPLVKDGLLKTDDYQDFRRSPFLEGAERPAGYSSG